MTIEAPLADDVLTLDDIPLEGAVVRKMSSVPPPFTRAPRTFPTPPPMRAVIPLVMTTDICQEMFDQLPKFSVTVFDRDLNYLFIAGGGVVEAGFTPEQLVGTRVGELSSAANASNIVPRCRAVLETGIPDIVVVELERVRLSVAVVPRRVAGEIVGGIMISHGLALPSQGAQALTAEERGRARQLLRELEGLLFR